VFETKEIPCSDLQNLSVIVLAPAPGKAGNGFEAPQFSSKFEKESPKQSEPKSKPQEQNKPQNKQKKTKSKKTTKEKVI